MASERDVEVEGLLGEIETRKFLHEEDLITQVDPEQLAEDAKTIKELEARLQELLGNNSPGASIEQSGQLDPTERPGSTLASTISSTTASAAPSVVNSPAPTPAPLRTPARNGYGPSHRQEDVRTDLLAVAADPLTPSNAPSPFVPHSSQGPEVTDVSRKRPRHDSVTSPVLAPSKRQALINEYDSRMNELSAELDTKLARIRAEYEEKKNDKIDLELRAMARGVTIPEVLESLEEEREEEERDVTRDVNLERDGAMARKLQAEDSTEDDAGVYPINPPMTSTMPFLDHLPFRPPEPRRFDESGFRPASSIPRAYHYPYTSGPPSAQFIPQTNFPPTLPLVNGNLDDDIQEISGDSFNAQFGLPVSGMDPRGYGYPRYPPILTGHRNFPWDRDLTSVAMAKLEDANINNMEDDEVE